MTWKWTLSQTRRSHDVIIYRLTSQNASTERPVPGGDLQHTHLVAAQCLRVILPCQPTVVRKAIMSHSISEEHPLSRAGKHVSQIGPPMLNKFGCEQL